MQLKIYWLDAITVGTWQSARKFIINLIIAMNTRGTYNSNFHGPSNQTIYTTNESTRLFNSNYIEYRLVFP